MVIKNVRQMIIRCVFFFIAFNFILNIKNKKKLKKKHLKRHERKNVTLNTLKTKSRKEKYLHEDKHRGRKKLQGIIILHTFFFIFICFHFGCCLDKRDIKMNKKKTKQKSTVLI